MIFDERKILHRYKATSHAAVAGGVVMGGWFFYEHLFNHHLRWDLVAIMGAMAATKLAALLYYRLRE